MFMYLNKNSSYIPNTSFSFKRPTVMILYIVGNVPIVEVNYIKKTFFPLKIPVIFVKHHFVISVHIEKSLCWKNKFKNKKEVENRSNMADKLSGFS